MSAAAPLDRRLPWRWLAACVAVTLGWELSGLDLLLTRQFGTVQGFPWRHAWLTEHLLHDGARRLATLLALVWLWDCVRPVWPGPSRAERAQALAVAVVCWAIVPLIKRSSTTSCPWDLTEFGGTATALSHLTWGLADGGPGHCFPSGHATTAFGFLALVALWRPYRPETARWMALSVGLAGLVLAFTQLARGAHHLSHSLWSGCLCLAVVTLASRWAPPTQKLQLSTRIE